MNREETLIKRWKDKTKILGFSPEYVVFWRYIDDLIDNQKRFPKEIERLNNIINEIKNNWNDLTEDKVYLKMSKETLVKTIDIKRNTISYIRIKRDKLQARIDKAIRILNSAKNHYDNDKTNWAIERTLRVLKGIDKE